MLSEFDLIKRYFQRDRAPGPNTLLGIGDDCALLAPTPGKVLAISSRAPTRSRSGTSASP